MNALYIFIALIIGFLIVTATILNGKIAEKIGLVNDIFINFLAGLLTSALLLLLFINKMPTFTEMSPISKYYYLGGAVGIIVIFLSNIIVPKIPAAYLVISAFVGQILTSALIDYLFFDLFSSGKIIGGVLILIGLIYNINLDKKDYNKEDKANNREQLNLG